MRAVYWNNTERWFNHHHYELLIEDITGFDLKKSLSEESVKYMAKRLSDTKYQRRFKTLYTIYENEYNALVEKFNNQAESNGKIEVA
jgi:ribonuclease HIII